MNQWVTISINPPPVGKPIAVRTANKYGYGCNYDVMDISSDVYDQEEYETMLSGTDFAEWMDIS